MSSILKLRPVGNHVPRYRPSGSGLSNWHSGYEAIFLDSGTSALSGAIKLAIDARKPAGTPEVLIPAYGCPDLISAIVAQGAMPVLIDFIQNRPWMDLEKVEEAISANTVGIVAVNFLGIPERLPQLSAIAKHHSVYLIDDSAQCFPPVLTQEALADCIVLSFGRGKPINLMGGGALLVRKTEEPGIDHAFSECEQVNAPGPVVWAVKRIIMNILMARLPYSALVRLPFLKLGETRYKPPHAIRRIESMEYPMSSGVQAFLTRELRHLEYDRQLEKWSAGADCSLLSLECKSESGVFSLRYSYPLLRYPLLMASRQERDRLLNVFERAGLGVNALYGKVLPEIDEVKAIISTSRASSFANARLFAERLLVFPTHNSVSNHQVLKISEILKAQCQG